MRDSAVQNLSWVDEFIANVRSYVFVRVEDAVLIRRPNRVHKLNETGARILGALLDGALIADVLARIGNAPGRVRETAAFLCAVRQALDGGAGAFPSGPAVDVAPAALNVTALPVLAEIALTHRCNLRCAFCYAGCGCAGAPGGAARTMATVDAERILGVIWHRARVPSVSFTGGEPALVNDLPRLVRHAKHLGMRVNLITNGTVVTERLARTLRDHGLDSAQVSIEGVTAAVHERITGVAGSFGLTVAGARHLAAAGIVTHTNTTLCRWNAAEAALLPEFARDVLAFPRFSMNLMMPVGAAAQDESLVIGYAEAGAHIEAVRTAAELAGVEFMWYSPVPLCLYNTIANGLGNKGCSACDGLLSIGPGGDVLPCSSWDEPVGNLLAEPFEKVWSSRAAARCRAKMFAHPRCAACEHFTACHGACPLYWRHRGYEELPWRPHC
ncbi:radical SAM protein [bacterium]|nr:radical SAM protein [bacterium]